MIAKAEKRGFTLLELMIAIALTASIMTIAYTFYFFSQRSSSGGMDKLEIQKKLRSAIEHISSDLRSAKEIVRIEPGLVELKKFVDEREEQAHINLSGDSLTRNIKYSFVKKSAPEGGDILKREEDNHEVTMMKFDAIDENLFEAFTFDQEDNLVHFDHRENDSIMRSRISLVKIRFKVKKGKTEVALNTSVNPRYLFGFKQQPYWNFVK